MFLRLSTALVRAFADSEMDDMCSAKADSAWVAGWKSEVDLAMLLAVDERF